MFLRPLKMINNKQLRFCVWVIVGGFFIWFLGGIGVQFNLSTGRTTQAVQSAKNSAKVLKDRKTILSCADIKKTAKLIHNQDGAITVAFYNRDRSDHYIPTLSRKQTKYSPYTQSAFNPRGPPLPIV